MTSWVLIDLLIILFVARLAGGLSVKLGQPRVLGEIVAGVLLGPTVMGNAWATPWSFLPCEPGNATLTTCLFPPEAKSALGSIGSVALLLFMFLVGLSLPVGALKGRNRQVGLVAGFVLATPLAGGFVLVVSGVLKPETFQGPSGGDLAFAVFTGAMLAVTAFPVMARILQEMGLETTDMAIVGIAAAAVTTIGMFLMSSTAVTIAASSSPLPNIMLKYVLVAIYVGGFMVLLPKILQRFTERHRAAGKLTPELFAVVFIVLFASGVIADRLGINVIVGGFIAGVALPDRAKISKELSAQLGLFVNVVLLPVFLAFSGLNTDFRLLKPAALVGLIAFIVMSVLVKLPAGAVGARLGGLSWQEGALVGSLMNCRGLLVLVVAIQGVESGLISPTMQLCGVVAALVTTAMTGPLVERFAVEPTSEPDAPEVVAAPSL